MARVATAYVEIRPDLTGFAQELRARLDAIHVTKDVRIEPDTAGFEARLRSSLGAMQGAKLNTVLDDLGKRIGDALGRGAGKGFSDGLNNSVNRDRDSIRRIGRRVGAQVGRGASETADNAGRDFGGRFAEGLRKGLISPLGGIISAVGSLFRSRFLRNFGRTLSNLNFGRSLGRLGTAVVDTFATIGGAVADSVFDIGALLFGLGGKSQKIFEGIAQFIEDTFVGAGQAIVGLVPVVGQLIAAFLALVAAVALVNAVLAGVVLIIVPLVAGVLALVGAIIELGAVVVSALALIPSVLFGIAAGAGVAFLAWNKLKQAFTDSKLGAAINNLKDGLGDIVSKGVTKALDRLATNTIPALSEALDIVAQSLNNIILYLLDFASSQRVLDGLNLVLSDSSVFLGQMARFIVPVVSGLLTMARMGGGGLRVVADAIVRAGDAFARWTSDAADNGQMALFFDHLGVTMSQLLDLTVALSPLIGGLLASALEPAQRLLKLLTDLATRWTGWMDSVEGQTAMTKFFDAANSIVESFLPAIEAALKVVKDLTPVFADFMKTAGPVLADFIKGVGKVIEQLMPGLKSFTEKLGELFADPEFRQSMKEFAASVGNLIQMLGTTLENRGLITFLIEKIATLINFITLLGAATEDLKHADFSFPRFHAALDNVAAASVSAADGVDALGGAVSSANKTIPPQLAALQDLFARQLHAIATDKSFAEVEAALGTMFDPSKMSFEEWQRAVIAALFGVEDPASEAGKATIDAYMAAATKAGVEGAFDLGVQLAKAHTDAAERHRETYRLIGAQHAQAVADGLGAIVPKANEVGKQVPVQIAGGMDYNAGLTSQAGARQGQAGVDGASSANFFGAGLAFVNQLAAGIAASQAAYNAMHDQAQRLRNLLPSSPAKEGPLSGSGDVYLAGRTFTQRFANGMLKDEQLVLDAGTRIASAAYPYASPGSLSDISDVRTRPFNASVWIGNEQFNGYIQAQIDADNEALARAMIYGRSGV